MKLTSCVAVSPSRGMHYNMHDTLCLPTFYRISCRLFCTSVIRPTCQKPCATLDNECKPPRVYRRTRQLQPERRRVMTTATELSRTSRITFRWTLMCPMPLSCPTPERQSCSRRWHVEHRQRPSSVTVDSHRTASTRIAAVPGSRCYGQS